MEVAVADAAAEVSASVEAAAVVSAAAAVVSAAAAVVSAGLLLEQAVTEKDIAVARPSAATYFSIIILGKFSWRRSRCKLTCTQWEIFLPKFLKSSFLLP